MRERRPAPQEHVDDRSERDGRSVPRPDDALQLASQMGNVAFTALARSVARQPADEVIEFPPETITASPGQGDPEEVIEFPPETIYGSPGEGDPEEVIEFPPETIYGSPGQGEPEEVIEFPPDYIGPGT